jgi:hypothetical protein
MLAYFATIKDFNNNVEVIRCFAKYFEKILLLETNKYPEYQKYVTKKS